MSETNRDANLAMSRPRGDPLSVTLATLTLAGVLGFGVITFLPDMADYRYAAWTFCFLAIVASVNMFRTILVARTRSGAKLLGRSTTVSEREKWLEELFNQLGEGVVLVDAKGNQVVEANRQATNIIGLPKDKLIGADTQQVLGSAGYILRPGSATVEFNSKNRFGEDTTIVRRIFPVDVNGRKLLIESFSDVSVQKRVSAEREIYFQALRRCLQPVMITDIRSRILQVNQAFEKLYGYTEKEVRGQTPRLLNPGRRVYADLGISSEQYEKLYQTMWDRLVDPKNGSWEGEVPNLRKDGAIVWTRLFVTAIRDSSGKTLAYFGMPIDITRAREEEQRIRVECYRALTELAEARDNETGKHLKRIGLYSRVLAEGLGLPRKCQEDIELFAPLHDIGKVGIPDAILLAPRKLDLNECQTMQTHALIGHQILTGRPTLEMAAEIARSHHEWFDGMGYPDALRGEQIPLAARIVAVADVYDALRSPRQYKPAWTHAQTAKLIREETGTHFDPQVVAQFVKLEAKFQEIADQYGDTVMERVDTGHRLTTTEERAAVA